MAKENFNKINETTPTTSVALKVAPFTFIKIVLGHTVKQGFSILHIFFYFYTWFSGQPNLTSTKN
jgi:hypothetical protein